jgi:hypothetical protein
MTEEDTKRQKPHLCVRDAINVISLLDHIELSVGGTKLERLNIEGMPAMVIVEELQHQLLTERGIQLSHEETRRLIRIVQAYYFDDY